jgi:hypothetical protein
MVTTSNEKITDIAIGILMAVIQVNQRCRAKQNSITYILHFPKIQLTAMNFYRLRILPSREIYFVFESSLKRVGNIHYSL